MKTFRLSWWVLPMVSVGTVAVIAAVLGCIVVLSGFDGLTVSLRPHRSGGGRRGGANKNGPEVAHPARIINQRKERP
jgi:hypothetical protein